jgi:hypothetical protein
MYTNDRNAYRQAFFTTWQKYKKNLALEAHEAQILEVILLHPEYQSVLENPQTFEQQEFAVEENPFLHLALHISVREQLQLNRPEGIKDIYQQLLAKYHDAHQVEHMMVECLGQVLWESQQGDGIPNEQDYLTKLLERCAD